MKTQSVDTSPDVENLQMELLGQAGPTRRANLMRGMITATRRMSRGGLKRLHPTLSEREIDRLFVKHLYGIELDLRVMPERRIDERANEDVVGAFEPVVAAFEKLNISYLIGGSVASSVQGLPRTTIGADLVADLKPHHIPLLVAELSPTYYIALSAIQKTVTRQSSFNVLHLASMTKVDIFILKASPFDQMAFSRKELLQIDSTNSKEFFLSTAEDILLYKLDWYRAGGGVSERQWLDVLGYRFKKSG